MFNNILRREKKKTCTRPSSELYIFKSWRYVLWRRSRPVPSPVVQSRGNIVYAITITSSHTPNTRHLTDQNAKKRKFSQKLLIICIYSDWTQHSFTRVLSRKYFIWKFLNVKSENIMKSLTWYDFREKSLESQMWDVQESKPNLDICHYGSIFQALQPAKKFQKTRRKI